MRGHGLALAVVLTLLVAASGAAAQPSAYGVVTHDIDSVRAAKMTELGAGFARITFRWWQIEPQPGVYNWGFLDDHLFSQAAPRGIQLFVSFGEPPEWAGGGPEHNRTPRDMNEWYTFVYQSVRRYRSVVRHWGIWNEPNLGHFLENRDDYEAIAFWARKAIKDADAAALVLGPEVSEHALDDGWFAKVMSSFGRELFDIVTVHYYTGGLTARMDTQVYPWRYGKEVWLTETGQQTFHGVRVSEEIQRSFYGAVLAAFEPRRWWWTKTFFYDIWAWDYGYRFGLTSPTWSNSLAFGFYHDWIASHAPFSAATDTDSDGLPDSWEGPLGLDTSSAIGVNGASGDADGDGRTNLQEYQAGTHPRSTFVRYFAEGADSDFFDTTFALLNVSATAHATAQLRFLKSDGTRVTYAIALPKLAQTAIRAKDVPGLGSGAFSTVIEADRPIVADRRMSWDARAYGSHAETAIEGPAVSWYLAEGATHSGFDLFYLLQNPGTIETRVQVTYLLPAPAAPVIRTYVVPAASRYTIWVDREDARLAGTDVSAAITADAPIIVERAMYLEAGALPFGAGHDSAGVTQAAANWFFAEGATGSFFDMFLLLANPGNAAAQVTVTYLLTDGATIDKTYTVPAASRFTIWVNREDARLADAAMSATVTSTNGVPIIAERTMWWPGPTAGTWREAHNSPGATTTGTRWAIADGEVGPAAAPAFRRDQMAIETYLLIANTSAFAGTARVTLYFTDGTTVQKNFSVRARSRFNVDVAAAFPTASGRRFGAIIDSTGFTPAQLVVERAIYSNASGVKWAAGATALAVKLQ